MYFSTNVCRIVVGSSKQLDISWPSQEFFEKCRTWEPYDANGMNVCLSVAKGYELPDELFEEGETKPIKPIKAKRKRVDENAADQEVRPNLSNSLSFSSLTS